MILLSNAVESNVASATSTYPALILKVQQGSSTMFKNLQIYCPTTMSGSPTEACFATNNWLEAPIKPHNGADDYDFKPGGIIIISYADGNLNSPQFVRWLNVSDDIIETNYGYILGNPIVPDAVLSIWDDQITLSDPILQKAVSLLPYVQICATGSKNLTASQYIQRVDTEISGFLSKSTVYRKCGKYGVELIAKEASTYADGRYKGNLNYLYTTKEAPNTTFLSICSYLCNKVGENPHKIVDVFNRAVSMVDSSLINSVTKDDTTVLYLFQMLAGYGNFKTGGNLVNSKLYQEYNKSSLERITNNSKLQHLIDSNSFYNRYDLSEQFCSYFWYVFDEGFDSRNTYNKEIDRIYAIIMHNNLFRLKQSWFAETVSKNLVCCAIIATAYPSLEYYILHPETVTNEMNTQLSIFLSGLKTMKDIATESTGNSGHYGVITTSHIAKCFAQLLYYIVLGVKQEDVRINETKIYKNILLMLNSVLSNWGSIYSKLGETLTTKPGTIYIPPSTTSKQFIWPMPGFPTITSPFGPRWGSQHNGIDISGTNVYGKPAVASAAGKVIISRLSDSAGNYVAIDHGNGYVTRYLHGSERLVNVGDTVYQGQAVILVGNTGNVVPKPTASNPQGGTHLHFDISYNGTYKDPQNYVKYGN